MFQSRARVLLSSSSLVSSGLGNRFAFFVVGSWSGGFILAIEASRFLFEGWLYAWFICHTGPNSRLDHPPAPAPQPAFSYSYYSTRAILLPSPFSYRRHVMYLKAICTSKQYQDWELQSRWIPSSSAAGSSELLISLARWYQHTKCYEYN
jgi:hypothetical protein